MSSATDQSLSGGNGLVIDHCFKSFSVNKQDVTVLRDINLTIHPGEFFCIIGGSGCGKSTLLKMIAGLEASTSGSISIDGRPITKPGLDRGMVFQEHRLLPWLTVQQNIDFGLRESVKLGRAEIVQEHIELVGLHGFENAYPGQLSGGMAQRVGLARALVNRPEVLLLDEPLGALDALTREKMQNEILRIWEVEKTTMILVTHDIDEAIYLADRIAVLGSKPGVVRHVYDVDLPRTRSRGDAGFDTLRHKLWDAIFQPSSPVESVSPAANTTARTSESPAAKPQYSIQ
ncbi:ABC transporter ATP-binding protein [Blastopirellula marina]|uniref:Sulfonate ABC transporter ATP-binding protein n=1 Tax=Blastopirellula marina TaxID=124 RepID=A0A2S8G9D5_9BACT|nr:ABC transporter ATP-binding protein [Blastopirellula marina]PQO41076.1 sulfonate ABC transporter ATP-binding protein [Blastopirellula marina]PTL45952.1 ABC transporter ATP-binding protein [Blastopirellula marina]